MNYSNSLNCKIDYSNLFIEANRLKSNLLYVRNFEDLCNMRSYRVEAYNCEN